MRGSSTSLVVVAVCGLALAATVDALRRDPEPPPHEAPTPEDRAAAHAKARAAASLRAEGVKGVLTYSDDECGVHAVTLPDLRPHPAEARETCLLVSSSERRFRIGPPGGDAEDFLVARCRDSVVEVTTSDGRVLATAAGCSPAWRSFRALAVVRDGEVHEVEIRPRSRGVRTHTVLTKPDLKRALGPALNRSEFAVKEVASLGKTRFAAIVHAANGEESADYVAVFDGGRLVRLPLFGYDELSNLRVSPRATYAAANSSRGVAIVDRSGRSVQLLVPARAVAWSPDERWVAAATETGIAIFRARRPRPQLIYVPFVASDVVWR